MSAGTNHLTGRLLGGTGNLIGLPPNALFTSVVDLASQALPLLAAFAMKESIKNENGLNHHLSLFMSKIARQNNLPFIVQHQSMEDITRGNSPAPDIGIHLDIPDEAEPPPRITVFEGKQLSTSLTKIRRREYVIGHEEDGKHVKCGGIERFKVGIHGGKLNHAGMIGYIQDETPVHWQDKINSWISELSREQHDPAWSEQEHLMSLTIEGRVTECSSLVCRQADQLHLTHLWINLGT